MFIVSLHVGAYTGFFTPASTLICPSTASQGNKTNKGKEVKDENMFFPRNAWGKLSL